MIIQDTYIHRASWHVRVYHAVDTVWSEEIINDLVNIGCSGQSLIDAKTKLRDNIRNTGYTFSSPVLHETIMIILPCTSGEEYWNSIDHEKNHLLQHISLTTGIDPYGEEISYISGEFIRDVYRKAGKLLCDCCRNEIGLRTIVQRHGNY